MRRLKKVKSLNFKKALFVFLVVFFMKAGAASAANHTGIFESATIDFGTTVNLNSISWVANIPPTAAPFCNTLTGASCAVKFQVAANNDNATWNYVGPTGPGTFFVSPGDAIHPSLSGNRYFRYKVYLYTEDSSVSPTVSSVSINFSTYPTSAELVSSAYDTNIPFSALESISWVEGNISATENIKLQISTSPDGVSWSSWYGPTGTSDFFDYTDGSNGCSKTASVVLCTTLPSELTSGGDDRYIRYKAILTSSGGVSIVSPKLSSVSITFNDSGSPFFESATINFGGPATITALSWTATNVDSTTQTSCDTSLGPTSGAGCAVKFQIAANNDNATWNYVGPDGTSSTYFTVSGQSVPSSLYSMQYFRYKLYLSSINPTTATPKVSSVTLECASCVEPAYIESSPYNTTFLNNTMENVSFVNQNTANLPGAVKFQFRTMPDDGFGNPDFANATGWCGPDDGVPGACDTTTYFTDPSDYFDDIMKDGVDDQWFQYRMYLSSDSGGVPLVSSVSVTYSPFGSNSLLTQSGYRFFEEADSTSVINPLASQDQPAQLVTDNQAFRLRMLVHTDNVDLPAGGGGLKLQFSPMSGSCDTGFVGETYQDVTTTSAIAFYNNLTPADGDPFSANPTYDPVHVGHSNVGQTYEEANNASVVNVIPVGSDAIWDFSLYDNTAPTNVSYCFRLVKSNGAALTSYSVIPQVNTRIEVNTNFTFNQNDWSSGPTSGTRDHATEILSPGSWTEFFFSDPDILFGTDITIKDQSGSFIQNSSSPSSNTYFDSSSLINVEVINDEVRLQSN